MAASAEELTVTFVVERETKGTKRFQERHADGEEPVVGSLYVRKAALAKLGDPDTLTVVIRGAD